LMYYSSTFLWNLTVKTLSFALIRRFTISVLVTFYSDS
jgi:hypothetical protein